MSDYSGPVLLLLPPSEGKTPAPSGRPPVDLSALSSPELTSAREQVLNALIAASSRPDALTVLKVGASLAAEVASNVTLRTAPAHAASSVYSGVLYSAAGLNTLDEEARSRAASSVAVVSALWGTLTPDDIIPAYRLAMATRLPPLGALASFWRPYLSRVLDPRADGDVVVDCRSTPYAAAWRPPRTTQWVTVKVLREQNGKRSVVSHNAKYSRGLLTRHLLTRSGTVNSPDDLVKAAEELIGASFADVEFTAAQRKGSPSTLQIIVG